MEFIIALIVIFILFKLLNKKGNTSKKNIFYYILLFLPLCFIYAFLICLVSGLILNLIFGGYSFYYGLIIGMAFSPLAAIITILNINKKNKNQEND